MIQVCCQLNELKVPFFVSYLFYFLCIFFLSFLLFSFYSRLYWCELIFDKLSDPDLIVSSVCVRLSGQIWSLFMLHTKSSVLLISYFLHYFHWFRPHDAGGPCLYKLMQRYPLVHLLAPVFFLGKVLFSMPMIMLFDFVSLLAERSTFGVV